MPELAEVEFSRRQWDPGLRREILGLRVHPRTRIFRDAAPRALRRALAGTALRSSRSHGKRLYFSLGPQRHLEVHLGMAGRLFFAGAGGFDLASLNIQRGRDHGVPGYNDTRVAFGLKRMNKLSEISSDREVRRRLASIYPTVDDIDLWVGGLAEDHYRDAMVGETFYAILKYQFEVLRDGDRFWYERDFRGRELAEIRRTRLADIIRRNTEIRREIRNDVFRAPATRQRR